MNKKGQLPSMRLSEVIFWHIQSFDGVLFESMMRTLGNPYSLAGLPISLNRRDFGE